VEQTRNVVIVITHPEPKPDKLRYHRARPYSRRETRRYRPPFNEGNQLLVLLMGQTRGDAGRRSATKSIGSLSLKPDQPSVNRASRYPQLTTERNHTLAGNVVQDGLGAPPRTQILPPLSFFQKPLKSAPFRSHQPLRPNRLSIFRSPHV
jgi:hypothetical protein